MHDDVRERDDRFDREAVDAAARAVQTQLARCLERNPAREIRKLSWAELRHIAIDAVGAYIRKRSEQRTIEEIEDLLTPPTGGESPLQ
jgi:hypothetical protein